MVELLTKARPSDMQSAHEINRRVRQFERELTILGAMPFPKSGLNGATAVEAQEQAECMDDVKAPPTQDPYPSKGGLRTVPPGGSKTTSRRRWHLLPKGLCRIGIHRGEWRYLSEGNCTQGLECGRCGSVHGRTKHQREWRYVDDGACGQLKVCKRCIASNGSRTRHQAWSK